MQKNLQVRIVKRDQRASLESHVSLESRVEVARVDHSAQTEREMRAVVAGWVSEHRERSQDYGRALAVLFAKVEPRTPQAA
jgi:hypothetical protein